MEPIDGLSRINKVICTLYSNGLCNDIFLCLVFKILFQWILETGPSEDGIRPKMREFKNWVFKFAIIVKFSYFKIYICSLFSL